MTEVDPRGYEGSSATPERRVMLARADLDVAETWGSWDGEPYGFESRRLIVYARKPA